MFGAVLAGSMGQERPASRPHVSLSVSAQTRPRERSDTITSVTDKSRQQQRALRGTIYICCALCYANGRITGRHAYSTIIMPFLIYRGSSGRKRCHASRDKVQSEVDDVVTDIRPRLVAPHPREMRQNTVVPYHLIRPYLVS